MFENNYIKRISGVVLSVSMLICLFFLTGCSADNEPVDHTVSVRSEGGMPFADVMLQVYEDDEMTELLWAGETDKEGTVSFKAPPKKDGYFAKLENIPEAFACGSDEGIVSIYSDATDIILEAVIKDGGLDKTVFKRGSVIRDFTVTADGKEYKISEILEEKKAVVLNFWFLNCGPCRSEFPHMQNAYEKYSDKIEILALNPYDGTESEVAGFAKDNGLTFPMAKCGGEFINAFGVTSYPTTVVIDRYGVVCMLHTGAIPDSETFEKIFEYFTADDYTQKIIRNISDIDK